MGQDGVVYDGVGWTIEGSHTYGYNDIALGIAFMGNFVGKTSVGQRILSNEEPCGILRKHRKNGGSIVTLEVHGRSAEYFRFKENSQ